MEENQGTVVTFLVISAAIEWLEQHHINKKDMKDRKIREKKEAEDAILTVLLFVHHIRIFFLNINFISFIRKSLWVPKLQWKISWLGKWNLMPEDWMVKLKKTKTGKKN